MTVDSNGDDEGIDRCPACHRELVVITTSMAGEAVSVVSCGPCGTRSWVRDGRELEITDVLEAVRDRAGQLAPRSTKEPTSSGVSQLVDGHRSSKRDLPAVVWLHHSLG